MKHVEDLRPKLQALIEAGHFADLTEIAAALGRKPATLNWWADGNDDRPRNMVSADRAEVMIALLMGPLQKNWLEMDARDLALGPAQDYQSALTAAPVRTLNQIIAAEADRSRCRLLRRGAFAMVELEDRVLPDDVPLVLAGALFRLEFERKLMGHTALVLQHAHQSWGVVPSSYDAAAQIHHVPGTQGDAPGFVRERRDVGRNRFLLLEALGVLPNQITRLQREGGTLDTAALTWLTSYLERTPRHQRHLHLIEIEIAPAREENMS